MKPNHAPFKFLATMALLLLAAGCFLRAHPKPIWPEFTATPVVEITAPQIVEALNQRAARKEPLTTARLKLVLNLVKIKKNATGHSETAALDGVLILQKPNLVRLRTYLPLGAIAFDLLYHDNQVELYIPERRELNIVTADNLERLKLGTMPLKLPIAADWWRLVDPWEPLPLADNASATPPGPSTKKSSVSLVASPITNDAMTGLLIRDEEQYYFEWSSGRILKILRPVSHSMMELSYSKWDYFDRREYASLIQTYFEDIEKNAHLSLSIDIKDLEENPKLPAEAFQPVDSRQLKVTRLN